MYIMYGKLGVCYTQICMVSMRWMLKPCFCNQKDSEIVTFVEVLYACEISQKLRKDTSDLNTLGRNFGQRQRQAIVASVTFVICIQLASVQSSPVQSRVKLSQRPTNSSKCTNLLW